MVALADVPDTIVVTNETAEKLVFCSDYVVAASGTLSVNLGDLGDGRKSDVYMALYGMEENGIISTDTGTEVLSDPVASGRTDYGGSDTVTLASMILSGVAAENETSTTIDVVVTTNHDGTVYALAYETGAESPVLLSILSDGTMHSATHAVEATITLEGLTSATTYDIYVVGVAAWGGASIITKVTASTT
jgi:hypothetical protein